MKNIFRDESGLSDIETGTLFLLIVAAFGILALVIAGVPGP